MVKIASAIAIALESSGTADASTNKVAAGKSGNAGVGRELFVAAGRKEWSIYSEILIPIFSPKFQVPGFYSLEITGGDRYEAFLNNDTNAFVPKVGVRWQPFDESLTIRSTWGEGFLEPSLVELFGPERFLLGPVGGNTFAPVAIFGPKGSATNPSQSATNPETTIEQLPNPNLGPEHDRTWTGGIVYTPKWIGTGSVCSGDFRPPIGDVSKIIAGRSLLARTLLPGEESSAFLAVRPRNFRMVPFGTRNIVSQRA